MSPFTEAEHAYLATQRLGRLATVDRAGRPQNNPVGFWINEELGTIDIGGRDLANSRKFANIENNPQVSFVVDDLASVQPWRVRAVEIRGEAQAVRAAPDGPQSGHFSGDVIRIRPTRILSWGLDPERPGMQKRNVARNPVT